jgi:hypothetical protein
LGIGNAPPSEYFYQIAQLRRDFYLNPESITGLADLSVWQLSVLEGHLNDLVAEETIVTTSSRLQLLMENGARVVGTYANVIGLLQAERANRLATPDGKDVNEDGVIDVNDVLAVILSIDAIDNDQPYLAKADIDGNGIVDGKDLCGMIDEVIGE